MKKPLLSLVLPSLVSAVAFATDIPVANFDANRTNANTAETLLTPTNVASGKFGKLGSWSTDGYVFAQPLTVANVTVSGVLKNLLIVVTMNNSVYAFDADRPGVTVWSNLAFATPYASYPVAEAALYGVSQGCLSTPAADRATMILYAVCENNTPNWILRSIDLTTGSTLNSATLSGQVTGTGDSGDTTSGANLVFNPGREFQRVGITLANGNIYIGFAGLDDSRPYHGWIIARRASDLAAVAIWCASPNGWGAGIWMSGGGIAVDGSGNLYVTTGNDGGYDGVTNFSNSVVKLSSTLVVLDWFTPSNNAALDVADADPASNRVLLIPGATVAVVAGKDFNVYVIDTTCMGHLQGSSLCSLQTFKTNAGGTPGNASGAYGMAFMNNVLYVPTTAGSIYAFTYSAGTFTTTPLATQTNSYGTPGPAQMAGSINGTSSGILWVITVASGTHTTIRAGTLRALNPTTLAEIWNSGISGNDDLGNMTKFAAPIPNYNVYVSNIDGGVTAYGIRSSGQIGGNSKAGGAGVIR